MTQIGLHMLTRTFYQKMFINLVSASLIFLLSSVNAVAKSSGDIVIGEAYWHDSKILNEPRKYQVSLPERYEAGGRKYPSLYIIDSEFHFLHVASTIKHLTRMGKLPPIIVVGIVNHSDKDYVYQTTWTLPSEASNKNSEYGGVKSFNKYVSTELVPLIDKSFRTNKQRALAGYSLGGLFVLNNYLETSSPFNAFLSMSPSVWYDDLSIIKRFEKAIRLEQHPLNDNLFISVANEQGMGVDELVDSIKKSLSANQQSEKPFSLNWKFVHIPTENHFTTGLPALLEGLEFLAPDYGKDGGELVKLGDYPKVLDYFDSLKTQWGGFEIEWLQAYQFAKYVFWSKQTDKVSEILAEIKKRFPESHTQVALQIATGFIKTKQLDKADDLIATNKRAGQKMPEWFKTKGDLLMAQIAEINSVNSKPATPASSTKTQLLNSQAQTLYSRAIELAKQADWEPWEINGLKP